MCRSPLHRALGARSFPLRAWSRSGVLQAVLGGLLLAVALAVTTRAMQDGLATTIPAATMRQIPDGPVAHVPRRVVVYVQPLGDGLSSEDIEATVNALTTELGADVRVLSSRPLPSTAYYAPRQRYRAERLLDSTRPLLPTDGDRILAVTARDISSTRGDILDWGLVGLSSYTHPVGVVSKYRCRLGSASSAGTRERLAKIAVHEIGHTLGLRHCDGAGCLMQDALGQVTVCERMNGFCPRCLAQLQAGAWLMPSDHAAPWAIRRLQ